MFHPQATAVIRQLTLPALASFISQNSEAIANAAAGILLAAIQSMLGKEKKKAKDSEEAVVPGMCLCIFFDRHQMQWVGL